MRRTELVSLLACCAALAGAACGSSSSEPKAQDAPPAAAAPTAPAPAPPPAPAAKPTDRVDDPSFELAMVAAGPYAPGKLGSFAVSLKPRGEYHINQEFPMSIALTPPADVDFPKTSFAKPEAAEFGEKSARFDVPFTPRAAGSHTVEAKVRFAVCTPENCVPDERTLALVLPVQ